MPDKRPDVWSATPQRFLRTPEAARLLGLSHRTLEKHRTHGTGPPYSKLGGRVVYAVADLQAWVEQRRKSSTSDTSTPPTLPAQPGGAAAPAEGGRLDQPGRQPSGPPVGGRRP